MAYVDIPGYGRKEYPDSMSNEDILRDAHSLVGQERKGSVEEGTFFDPRDLPLSFLAKEGASRMGQNIMSGITDLVPSMAGEALGYHKYAREQMAEREQALKDIQEAHPSYFPSLESVDDFGSGLGWAAERFGEQAPLLPLTIGPGLLGRAGAAALGRGAAARSVAESAAERGLTGEAAEALAQTPAAQRLTERAARNYGDVGLTAGLTTGSALVNVPETYEQIYDETGQLHPGVAAAFGGLKAGLDSMFASRLLSQLSPAGRDLLTAKVAQNSDAPIGWKRAFLQEATKNFAYEGGTEAAQDFIDSIAAQAAGSKQELFSKKHINSWLESGLVGGLTGGVIGAPGAALEAGRIRDRSQAEMDRIIAEGGFPPAEGSSAPMPTQVQLPKQEDVEAQRQAAFAEAKAKREGIKEEARWNEDVAAQKSMDDEERRQAEAFAAGVKNDYWQEKAGIGPGEQQDLFPRDLYLAQNIPQVRGAEPGDVYRENFDIGPAEPARTDTPVIDEARLEAAGIHPKKDQWTYKNLLGKDLSVDSDWKDVQGVIGKIRGNKQAKILGPKVENLVKGLMPYAEQQRIQLKNGALEPRIQGIAPQVGTPGVAAGAGAGLPSGPKSSVPTAGTGVSEAGRMAPPVSVPSGGVGGAPAQPRSLKDTLTSFFDMDLARYEKENSDPNQQQKVDDILNKGLIEAGYKPLTAEEVARGKLLYSLGYKVRSGGFTLPKVKKPSLPELQSHYVYGENFVDTLHKGNAALKALGFPMMSDDQLRRFNYAKYMDMHSNSGDYPHAKGHKLPTPPTAAPPSTPVVPPSEPKKPRNRTKVIPIEPKEQQDLGAERNTMREKARAAYSVGDLNPSQYALISNLLSKGEIEPVQRILDEIDAINAKANQPALSEEGRKKTKARGKANLENLIQLIGAQMYSGNLADVTIKEMVQNSFDAVKASLSQGLENEGKIDVAVYPAQRLIMIRDNGQGMTPKVIRDAFLTIAGTSKEGLGKGDASGGFGMAKAAFLLGNERIWVRTAKNGTRTTFEANGSEIFSKDIDMVEQNVPKDEHGTTIVVKVPETVPSESGPRNVWFPSSPSDISFFDKPMLNPNIEVNFADLWSGGYNDSINPEDLLDPNSSESRLVDEKLSPVALAKNFDMSGYHKEATANFDWGTADIYIGNERVGGRYPSVKHSVLSSGIYQFDMSLSKNFERVPYNIIVDVKPSVAATSPIYPFNIKREGWKDQIREDTKALETYLHNIFAGKGAADTVETFKNIDSLPRVDTELSAGSGKTDVSEFIVKKPLPKVSEKKAETEIDEASKTPNEIDISNGTVTGTDSSGKKVTYVGEKYAGSFTADNAPKVKDFLLDLGIDSDLPIYHNNTNVDYFKMHPDAPAFFAEIGSVFMDLRDKVKEINDGWYTYKSLEEPFFVGISVDKEYHGVNIVIPFKGAMLNPLAVKGTKLPSIVLGLYDTMVHEFAHIPERSHNADFVSEFHELNSKLAGEGFDLETRDKLTSILRKHKDLFNELRHEYEKSTTKNIARSIHETEEGGGTTSRVGRGAVRGSEGSTSDQSQPVYQRREPESGVGIRGDVAGGAASTGRGSVGAAGAAPSLVVPNTFSFPSAPFQTARGMNAFINKVPFFNDKQKGILSSGIDGSEKAARAGVLGFLPTHALSDSAAKHFPPGTADMFHKILTLQDGYIHEMAEKGIDVVMNKFRNARKAAPMQHSLFNHIVNESTLWEVDPTDEESVRNADRFSMAYVTFNPDGSENGKQVKYFDTADQRKAAIRAYNEGKPKEERAFAVRDPDAGIRLKADALVRKFNSLNPAWKDLYRAMRNANAAMLKEFKSSLNDRIDEAQNLDDNSRIMLKKSLYTRLAEAGMIHPYFALGREGNHWLAAEVPNKHGVYESFVTAFQDPLSRGNFENDLKNKVYQHEFRKNMERGMDANAAHDAAYKTAVQRVRVYENVQDIDYRRVPPGSTINDILGIIESKKPVKQEAETEEEYRERTKRYNEIEKDIMQLVINALPETSFLKSLQKRKKTAGYNEDTVNVFERKTRSNIRQIANLRYRPKIGRVLDAMRDYTDVLGRGQEEVRDPATGQVVQEEILPQDNSIQVQYMNEFNKHADNIFHPSPKNVSSIIKSALFGGTLGFNVSSGLIALSNLPMIVYPYLSAEYGMGATRRAMGNAAKVLKSSGFKRKIRSLGSEDDPSVMEETLKSGLSLGNYDPDSREGQHYSTLFKTASASGQLNRSQLYETLLSSARTTALDKYNAMAGWMLHTAERYNREVTLIAAYDLELERLKRKGVTGIDAEQQAANKAVYATEMVNGSIAASSAPRFAQSGLGSIVYMYKRFGVSQYYMQAKTVYDAVKSEKDPEARKMLINRFWALTGATALMSGVQGIPMFGVAAMIYNLFKDDDDDDFNTVARKGLGEFFYNGPLDYITGLSLASRVGLSNLIIKEPISSGESGSFSQALAESFGGPLPSMVDRFQRGIDMIARGNVERGIENLLPVFASNMMKGARYASEGAKTLRGDTIYDDVGPAHAMAQMLGFTPAEVARRMEFNAKEKGMSKAVTAKDSQIKGRYYLAYREHDYVGMQEAKQALLELGSKHPDLGYTPATIGKKLAESIKLHKAHTKRMLMGKEYPKKHMKEVMESARDLDLVP